MGNSGLPFRPPCGGWPATTRIITGGCYQHTRASEASVQHYDNVTVTAADGTPPASRDTAWQCSDLAGCAGGAAPVDCNCYHLAEGRFDNLSRCRKLGFKNAQASRVWHGRFGFTSHGLGCSINISNSPGLGCTWEAYQDTADDTKYCHIVAEVVFSETDYDAGGTVTFDATATYDRTSTIDPNTGKRVTTATQSLSDAGYSPPPDTYFNLADEGCWQAVLMNMFQSVLQTIYTDSTTLGSPYTYTVTAGGPTMTVTETTRLVGTDTTGAAYDYSFVSHKATVDCSSATATYDEWGYTAIYDANGKPYDNFLGSETHISAGNTSVSYDVDTHTAPSHAGDTHTHTSLTATLSSPNTSGTVYGDCTTLLGYWDLSDDKAYPWRTDGYVTIAPLVTRDEYPTPRTPSVSDTSADPATYTGAVLGGPNPAGYAAHFDWRHTELPFPECAGATDYGAWTPGILPSNATQWTSKCAAKLLWPGAWVWHQSGVVMMQKWAEVKIHRPAMNCFRPCGPDRFEVDVSTARCVASLAGTTVTLEAGVTTVNSGDLVLVNFGGAAGVYPVTKTSDTVYELGALAWALPGDAPAYAVQFGKIRWPAAWSICGRVAVASATAAGGTVTVELAAPAKYLRSGDAVDFTDAGGTVTEANKTVTVVDETHFTYAGAAAPTGIYVKSHGAPGYWWDDEDSKGDFLVFTWLHNFRDIGEGDRLCEQDYNLSSTGCPAPAMGGGFTCADPESSGCTLRQAQAANGMPRSVATFTVTEDCLSFSPCWPQVVCFSPNGEEFELGKTYAFPDVVLDERYGSLWQGAVEFVMPDPFWEAPPQPCPAPDSWVEDPGDCSGDFAHRPMVEARQSVPAAWLVGDTAPALPADVLIHVLTLAELSGGSPPSGIVMAPPAPVGDNLSITTQWTLWLAEVGCVCGGGAFSGDYEANEVSVNCPS